MENNTMQGNTSNPVPQLSAKIARLINKEGSMVRAVANVTIGNCFVIQGVCIMDSRKGLFVQMPRERYEKDGKSVYADRFFPITAAARSALNNCVLGAYESYVREIQDQYMRSMAAAAAPYADPAELEQPYPDPAGLDGYEPDLPF